MFIVVLAYCLLNLNSLCLCYCSLFLLNLATKSDVSYRSCNEDRKQCTEDYTKQHCEREAASALTTEAEDTEQHDEC